MLKQGTHSECGRAAGGGCRGGEIADYTAGMLVSTKTARVKR